MPNRGLTRHPSAAIATSTKSAGGRYCPCWLTFWEWSTVTITNDERVRRWRLVLGKSAEAAGRGGRAGEGLPGGLSDDDAQMDKVLQALYNSDRSAGLGSSC